MSSFQSRTKAMLKPVRDLSLADGDTAERCTFQGRQIDWLLAVLADWESLRTGVDLSERDELMLGEVRARLNANRQT